MSHPTRDHPFEPRTRGAIVDLRCAIKTNVKDFLTFKHTCYHQKYPLTLALNLNSMHHLHNSTIT